MRKLLWTPSKDVVETSNMMSFIKYVNREHGFDFKDYANLYHWSVEKPLDFWGSLWHFLDIHCSATYSSVAEDVEFMKTRWFVGAKLNYAENMLRYCKPDSSNPGSSGLGSSGLGSPELDSPRPDPPAIIFRGESDVRSEISRHELYSQVTRLARAMMEDGIKPGDTVAAYMPNIPQTVIAMLATAAIGAIWCSCATDIGPAAAVDRIGQIQPTALFTTDGYIYKGRKFNVLENAKQIASSIPSIRRVVVCHYAGDLSGIGNIEHSTSWDDYLADEIEEPFTFPQFAFYHPLVVMFSSGTTGKPKCMVQSAIGLLINQLKELILHSNLKPGDRLLYITTCSWMMWNWQAAALGAGATLVLYDGNPSYPDTANIWRILDEEKVTVFGLSASYIHALVHEGFSPRSVASLESLKEISQTGSALSDEGFDYVYREIKQDLFFNSIAGGTDINGCFAIGSPMSPVYSGELQAAGLGMKVNCYNESGKPIRDEQGELVCEVPAPSMPLYFWNDPDNAKYANAYFGVYPDVWRHGDYVVFHSETGGITFLGRSDSVLKPSGVRIGTSEIYNQVEKLPEIQDSLAIGQDHEGDQRVILFVHLKEGAVLDDALQKSIRTVLRTNASPRHVPAIIMACPDIPKTLNGKKVESAVTNIINGRKVTNRDALANPEALDFFESVLPSLQ